MRFNCTLHRFTYYAFAGDRCFHRCSQIRLYLLQKCDFMVKDLVSVTELLEWPQRKDNLIGLALEISAGIAN